MLSKTRTALPKYLGLIAALIIVIVAFIFVENAAAPSFHKCISYVVQEQAADRADQQSSIVPDVISRQSICTIQLIDKHNGFFGLLVAVAIACFTYTLRKTSIEQGKLTERAIEISDRALTIAQWPYLYITAQNFVTPATRPAPSSNPQFQYTVTVHGESPAIIRAVYEELVLQKSTPVKPLRKSGWRFAHDTKSKGEGWKGSMYWTGGEVISSPQEMHQARVAGKQYYAIGCIIYDDLFGNQHEFGFCYRGTLGGGLGARAGGRAYNYQRLRGETERADIDALAAPAEPVRDN